MPAQSLNYLMREIVNVQFNCTGNTTVRIANSFNKMLRPYKACSMFHTVPFYRRFVRTVAPLNWCENWHVILASTVYIVLAEICTPLIVPRLLCSLVILVVITHIDKMLEWFYESSELISLIHWSCYLNHMNFIISADTS